MVNFEAILIKENTKMKEIGSKNPIEISKSENFAPKTFQNHQN